MLFSSTSFLRLQPFEQEKTIETFVKTGSQHDRYPFSPYSRSHSIARPHIASIDVFRVTFPFSVLLPAILHYIQRSQAGPTSETFLTSDTQGTTQRPNKEDRPESGRVRGTPASEFHCRVQLTIFYHFQNPICYLPIVRFPQRRF